MIPKDNTKYLIEERKLTLKELYEFYEYNFETGEATCPICGSKFTMTKRQIEGFKKTGKRSICCSAFCSKSLLHIVNGSPLSKKEVRDKIKKTNLEKYGVEQALASKEVRDKIENTCLDKYGVKYVTEVKEVQDKIKETNLEKYGVTSTLSVKEVQDKIKETNLEKYGSESALKNKEVRDKIEETNLKKYNSKYFLSSEEGKKKIKKTCMEKYGVENPMQCQEVQKKFQNTCLEKFNAKSPLESEEIKTKINKTNVEKYGTANVLHIKEVEDKIKETNLRKYGVEAPLQSQEIRDKIKETIRDTYGVDYFCQHESCYSVNGKRISKTNKRIHELLLENNIENELEYCVGNYAFDLKVDNIVVEINPTYTHNSTIGPFFGSHQEPPKPNNYHLTKTRIAEENNMHCIHVFDWDNLNKIVNIFKEKISIPARKCEVRKIKKKEATEFLENYHLQSNTRSCPIAYGLYYKNELVQVMTFGKPRYNKNYEYELLRLCTNPNFRVVGGASKLLKHFENEFTPKSIISYCDLSKFTGKTYEELGFQLINISAPAKHWYNPKTKTHVTDNLLRQRGFDQLHYTNYGKFANNEELMLQHGYLEIFDCGQATYIKL